MDFNIKISIKLPIPEWKEAYRWGDYYFGIALKKEFEKRGCEVILQILPEWYNDDDHDCDVVIVLRGLTEYKPKKHHFNIMWNISHPNMITIEELNQYDHIFIASELWAEVVGKMVDVPVTPLLQCTDPELFYHEYDPDYDHELLFVGGYREGNRKIIEDLLPTDKDLSIYGPNWHYSDIDKKYIKGTYIENSSLNTAYSSCKILLNDHWKDMREKGFISNRLFDGFASGAFIISDEVEGVSNLFGDVLVTYSSPEELEKIIDKYLKDEIARNKKAVEGYKLVKTHHTYQDRVDKILKIY